MQNVSNSARLLWTSIQCCRCSVALRSGPGHSRTSIFFILSQSIVALAVCFASLSCENANFRSSSSFFGRKEQVFLQDQSAWCSLYLLISLDQLVSPCCPKTSPEHVAAATVLYRGDVIARLLCSVRYTVLDIHHANCLVLKPKSSPFYQTTRLSATSLQYLLCDAFIFFLHTTACCFFIQSFYLAHLP